MKDNQVLEMRMGALRNAATGLEKVVNRLQPERDAFKAEVERLHASTNNHLPAFERRAQ